MRSKYQRRLKEKFPLLFVDLINPSVTPQSSCMFWGIECGDGWYKILYDLGRKMEPLIRKYVKENPPEEGVQWHQHPHAAQVKEKFGTLRFYMNGETDEMVSLIHEAETRTETTCECCGDKAELRGESWVTTLCDRCCKVNQKRRKYMNTNGIYYSYSKGNWGDDMPPMIERKIYARDNDYANYVVAIDKDSVPDAVGLKEAVAEYFVTGKPLKIKAGWSRCSPLDPFVKKTGRDIAFGNLEEIELEPASVFNLNPYSGAVGCDEVQYTFKVVGKKNAPDFVAKAKMGKPKVFLTAAHPST